MRGTAVYPFRPPVLGLQANVPAHMVPEGALIGGQNCFLDIDGLYKPRFGYGAWKSTSPDQPLLGLLYFTDTDASEQYFGVSTQKAYALVGGVWTVVSSGTLTGISTDLVRIVDYYQSSLSGFLSAIFTNNHDPLQVWNRSLTASQPLTPTLSLTGTNAYQGTTSPTFTTYPVNQQFFIQVAHTNTQVTTTGTQNSPPSNTLIVGSSTGFFVGQGIKVAGAGAAGADLYSIITTVNVGNLVLADKIQTSITNTTVTGLAAISLNGQTAIPLRYLNNGVVTELPASYLNTTTVYNVAYDGTQFLIGTFVQAPIARDIFVLNGRLVALNVQYGAQRQPSQVVWTSAFDATSFPPLAYQNLLDTDDPLIAGRTIGVNAAVVYGEESAWLMQGVYGGDDASAFQFTPIPSATVGPVSPLAVIAWNNVHYYLARDKRIWSCDGSTAQPVSDAIDPILAADIATASQTQSFAFYHPYEKQLWFFYVPVIGALSAPSHAIIMAQRNGQMIFETLQIFTQPISAGATVVANTGVTWDQLTQPWSSYTVPWSSFLGGSELITLLCVNSIISAFGPNYSNDAGTAVPYSFIPALINAGPGKDLLLDSLELWLQPTTTEFAAAQIDGLATPLAAPIATTSFAFDCADPLTFGLPKSYPLLNTYSRYLKLTIFGTSRARALYFGGAQIFVTPQERASRN